MLNEQQNKKLKAKLEKVLEVFEKFIFQPVDHLEYITFETKEDFRYVPEDRFFSPPKEVWGGERSTCWFKGTYTPLLEHNGLPLYVMPHVGGYEALLWVNSVPCGTFATKIVITRHGNHYCDRICGHADPGRPLEIAIEFYAGHYVAGCQPFEQNEKTAFTYRTGPIDICVKNDTVVDFISDLRILLQIASMTGIDAFRRAEVMNTLTEVHKVLYYSPENVDFEDWMGSLEAAIAVMKPSLCQRNGDSAPTAVLVGHSHMDTAWLWTIGETIKKNARTISNQLSLMEQYPEYRFIQSASYHAKMMEQYYPGLFEAMKRQIASKRYEINGAAWIECDCNIPSGESLIRQFLWGQRYTREKFGTLSDCFWLPDTFGYSAAIPQIMKGFGVNYFLTTKLAWNDTNDFPYDTFVWEGLDTSSVIVHFFEMDTWPDPKGLLERLYGYGYKNGIKCKQASSSRLIAFGYGDGGGGPQFEMLELARRLENVEGCPKVSYSSVSDYMASVAKHRKLPKHTGELYLELHRGTLTGKQQIKKNNRKAEVALRNLEILEVMDAVIHQRAASDSDYRCLWETLLVNQFHDILPGSCIPEAHDQSIRETTTLLQTAEEMISRKLFALNTFVRKLPTEEMISPKPFDLEQFAQMLPTEEMISPKLFDLEPFAQKLPVEEMISPKLPSDEYAGIFTVFNPLGTLRKDVIYLPVDQYHNTDGNEVKTQLVTMPDGSCALAVANFEQKPLSFQMLKLIKSECSEKSAFIFNNNKLETPFLIAVFDNNGYICSLTDRRNSRELCGGTLPLNAFVFAEDVPAAWDTWDIDADCLLKLKSDAKLLSRGVVSDGCVEFRIRSEYSVCRSSRIIQDMVFYADSPLILFDTKLEWRDKHRLLKVSFDTSIKAREAVFEIQFGNIKRPTTRNNTIEQAMFEVCNHKYTDLSEPGYGVTLLNDCKYGISAEGSCMSLSLAKGGLRPDDRGDTGDYRFKYAFLPHLDGFHAENIVHRAYEFNHDRLASRVNPQSGAFAAKGKEIGPSDVFAFGGPDILQSQASSFKTPENCQSKPFAAVSGSSVILETIKPCEDSEKAFILRLYECEGTWSAVELFLGMAYTKLELCDMLEQPLEICGCHLTFQPFEIKTIKVSY